MKSSHCVSIDCIPMPKDVMPTTWWVQGGVSNCSGPPFWRRKKTMKASTASMLQCNFLTRVSVAGIPFFYVITGAQLRINDTIFQCIESLKESVATLIFDKLQWYFEQFIGRLTTISRQTPASGNCTSVSNMMRLPQAGRPNFVRDENSPVQPE